MNPQTPASENELAFFDDDFDYVNGPTTDCCTANNSLPLCMLSDPTLQDDTAIVKGGPTGPTAQSVSAGSVHSSIVAERSESTTQFAMSNNDRSHMQDVPVEQSSYYDQWIRVGTVNWNSSTQASEHLILELPEGLLNSTISSGSTEFTANNPALNIFNSSAFVSWDAIEAYVTVSSPPNVSGLAILTACPYSLYPADMKSGSNDFYKSQIEIDKIRAFNMPHVKVSYTESNSAILTVPWNFEYASASTTSNMCVPTVIVKLALFNFITPECGAGSSSDVSLTLFVRFKGLRGEGKRPLNVAMTYDPSYSYVSLQDRDDEFDFKYSSVYTDLCNQSNFKVVYDYEYSGPPHMRTWCASAVVTYNGEKYRFGSRSCFTKQHAKQDIIRQIVSKFSSLQDLTSVLGTVSNIASTVADLSNPVKLTSTIGSLVSGGVSKLLGGVTLDAPWSPPAVESRIVPLNVDNFPGGVGARKVVVMDIDDSHHESPLEGISYSDPDMTDALYRPGLLFAVDVPVNTPTGVLFHIPCSVIDGCVSFDGVSNLKSGTFKPTPAGMAASLYQYVQGTKIYDFMLVKSVMQTVTLNFAFNPTFPPRSRGHAMAGRSETVTFQEDVAKSIECPIISPWRLFPHNTPRLMLKSETGEPFSGFGYLTVTLVNPITSNALCASSVKLVVSSKFAPGVKLYCPRVSNLTTAFSGPVSNNVLQDKVVVLNDVLPEDEGGVVDEEVAPVDDVEEDLCWCQKCTEDRANEEQIPEFNDEEVAEFDEEDTDESENFCRCEVDDALCDYCYTCALQDEVSVKESENYENGASIAPPVVTTQRIVHTLDGFGASPSLKDCARRFDDYFTFKGKLASEVEGSIKLFVIPISPIPGKTITPDSATYQISSPNAFQTLSLTHAYFGGSVDVNISVTGIPNGTATVRYVNGVPLFSYVSTTTPLRTAVFNTNWHILDIKTPLTIPAYIDQVVRDYSGMRAKEKRSLETNNQLTLGLPNHTEFSAISTVATELGFDTLAPNSLQNTKWIKSVRPSVMGYLIVSLEVPPGQSVEGSIVVDLRAADSAHWSWPTGTPLCGTAVGLGQPVLLSVNLLECPSTVVDKGNIISADLNSALQYFSRPVGGSVGAKMYPVSAGVSAAVQKKKLMESGDVETNPGPAMSTLGSGDVSNLSSATAWLKQWTNSACNGTANTVKAMTNIPTLVNGMNDSVPLIQEAAKGVSSSSSAVGNVASTMTDILTYVQEKIKRMFDLPVTSMLSILHYVQIMLDARKKSITISCFAGILYHLGLITFDAIAAIANQVSSLFSGSFQDSDAGNIGLRYFNIIFSFILAGIGLVFTPLKKIPGELLNKTTAIFRNINCIDTFMKNNFDLISHGTTWYTAQRQKCELMLVNLGDLQPEVELWISKANAVISAENVTKIDTETNRQNLLISCAKEGTVLFGKIAKLHLEAPESRPISVVYNMVDKTLAKVRSVYVEHVGKFLLADKYSVPFCVWLYGEPGIGKSHVVPTLAADYLSELNIPCDGDPLYRRSAGAKFWDGLGTQPLLWLSDPEQDNSDEGISQFVRDWYEILSPIPFTPNMANVNEKGKSHKFLGTFVDSNSFFSNKRNLVLSEKAFKSRRDVVAEIVLSSEFKIYLAGLGFEGRSKIEDFSAHVKTHPGDAFDGFENYSHLRVRYSFDGNVKPDSMNEVSFAAFRKILKEKLIGLTSTRRLNSKAKSDLFESLSTENTARKLATMSNEKVKSVIDTISAIVGTDSAEKLKNETEKAKEEMPDDDEFNEDLFGIFQDKTVDSVAVGEMYYECMNIGMSNVECVHDLLIKYSYQDFLNLSVINARPAAMQMPALLRSTLDEGDFHDKALVPDPSQVFCYLSDEKCMCSTEVRSMAFALSCKYIPIDDRNVFKEFLGAFDVKLTSIIPTEFPVISKICAFLSTLAIAGAIVCLIVWLCRKFFGSPKSQDYERMMKTPKVRAPGAKVMSIPLKLQDTESVIMKGCGRFSCTYTENDVLKEISTNMYSLGGTAWYLPGHTIIKLRKYNITNCTFTYKTHAGSPVVFVVPWSECTTKYAFEVEHDVGVISHPRLQPVRKKVNLFATAQELSQISSELCVYDWNGGTYSKTNVSKAKVQIAHPDGNQQQLLIYKGFQGDGLCGSPVVDIISGKIVGFHNAGWPHGWGGATICGKPLVEQLIKESGALFTDVDDFDTKQTESAFANDFCVVEEIVDPTFVGRVSTKSSLQKSSMYGVLGEPEKVIPTGKLEDAFKCMEPYSKEPKVLVLPDWIVDGAAEEYAKVIIKNAPPVSAFKPKPLPVKTALEGIPNLPFHLPPMRDTSSGLPLVNLGLPKKGQCFSETIDENGRHITGLNPKFVKLYNKFSQELQSGCKPKSNAMLFLKDERKKPNKAIRGINGSDFVIHVMFLQYFLPFFAAYRKAKFRVGSAISCNIDNEAFEMFKYMGEVEEDLSFTKARYITADYKNFGPTIIHHFAGKIIDIIVKWYEVYGDVTPHDVLMMRRLFAVMLNSDHIVLHYWFRPQQGIFSGNPFTAEFNTFVNNLYIRGAWLYTCSADKKLSAVCGEDPFFLFREKVRIVTYGDDLVARTHSSLYPVFNNITIKSFMDLIGLEFTDALKRPTMVETDEFDKVSFLKRSFKLHPDRYNCLLAALDIGTIRDMICYVRGKGEIDQKSVVIAKDAVRFLHGHGPAVFDEMRSRIVSFCENSESDILRNAEFMSWSQIDAQVFDVQDDFVRSVLGSC